MNTDNEGILLVLSAAHFAAAKHRDQRRKGTAAEPYVNHPIEAAELIARVAGVTDPVVLAAALLHDTVEDTATTPEDLRRQFGEDVANVVAEVTDDKTLPQADRKRLQIEHAPHLSGAAKLVKLADKICNVTGVAHDPPPSWAPQRCAEYLDWAERVVAGLRGVSPALEKLFDERLAAGRARMKA